VSNSSFTIFPFPFFRMNLLTSSLHFLNQSTMLLTSPFSGLGSYSQTRLKGLRSAQPQSLWRLTHFMYAVSANPFISSLMPTLVAPLYSASKSTQCRKCWRFGPSTPLCKEEAQSCPICILFHHRSAHRCANQSCPKGGFEKSVVGCCNASPPLH